MSVTPEEGDFDPQAVIDALSNGGPAAQPQPQPPQRVQHPYDPYIEDSAARHGVDPDLVRAVTQQESTFKPGATSPKGASGLMQLMPATASRFGVTNIYDPKQNIEGGTKYLKFLLDRFHGDIPKTLAGYNAGEGAVDKYNGVPPYKETQNYVARITGRYKGNGYAFDPQQVINHLSEQTATDQQPDDGQFDPDAVIAHLSGDDTKGVPAPAPAPTNPATMPFTPATNAIQAPPPVPEVPATLEAQRQAASDPASTRAAVLYTPGSQVPPIGQNEVDIQLHDGSILRANENKLHAYIQQTGIMPADLISGKADFTPLIGGKAQPNISPTFQTPQLVKPMLEPGEPVAQDQPPVPQQPVLPPAVPNPANPTSQSRFSAFNEGQPVMPQAPAVTPNAPFNAFPNQPTQTPLANQVQRQHVLDSLRTGEQPVDSILREMRAPTEDAYNEFLKQTGLPNDENAIREFNLAQQKSVEGANESNQADFDRQRQDFYQQKRESVAYKPHQSVDLKRVLELPTSFKGGSHELSDDELMQTGKGYEVDLRGVTGDKTAYASRAIAERIGRSYGLTPDQVKRLADAGFAEGQVKPDSDAVAVNVPRSTIAQYAGADKLRQEYDAQRGNIQAKWVQDTKALNDKGVATDIPLPTDPHEREVYLSQLDSPFAATSIPEEAARLRSLHSTTEDGTMLPRTGESASQDAQDSALGRSLKDAEAYLQSSPATSGAGSFGSQAISEIVSGLSDLGAGVKRYVIDNPVTNPVGYAANALYQHATGKELGTSAKDLDDFADRVRFIGQNAEGDTTYFKMTGAAGRGAGSLPQVGFMTALGGGNPIIGFGLNSLLTNSAKPAGEQMKELGKNMALGALFSGIGKAAEWAGTKAAEKILTPEILAGVEDEAKFFEASQSTGRNIQKLVDEGSTAGERAAATNRLQAFLDSRGMTEADLEPDAPVRSSPEIQAAIQKAALVKTLVTRGTNLGLVAGTGFAAGKLEGHSNKDAAIQALQWGALDVFMHGMGKEAGDPVTHEDIAKADGKVLRLPDPDNPTGPPRDVAFAADETGDNLRAVDVTNEHLPAEAIDAQVLPTADGKPLTPPKNIKNSFIPTLTDEEKAAATKGSTKVPQTQDAEQISASELSKAPAQESGNGDLKASPSANAAEVNTATAAEAPSKQPTSKTNEALAPDMSTESTQEQNVSTKAENIDTSTPIGTQTGENVTEPVEKNRDVIEPPRAKGSSDTNATSSEVEKSATPENGAIVNADDRPIRTVQKPATGHELPEPRKPTGTVAQGKATEIRIPGAKTGYQARYAIRELEDVIPSHHPTTFQPNADYFFTNDRHYDKEQQYQEQVRERSKPDVFAPSEVVNNNPTADTGPPILDADGNVLGGNSRSMILHRIYGDADPTARNAYRKAIYGDAALYGLGPKTVLRFKRPVLVREINDASVNSQAAISDLNRPSSTALTASERSVAEGRRMSEGALDYIGGKIEAAGKDATLNDALNLHGTDIVNRLIEDGVFAAGERNTLLDNGKITDDGKARLGRILNGQVFEDLEQLKYAPAYVKRNIERAIAPLVKTQGDAEWNIVPETREAIDLLTEFKAKGNKQNLDEYAQTPSMAHGPWSHAAINIAKILQQAPNTVSRAFKGYAGEYASGKSGGGLFGSLSQKEAFDASFGPKADGYVDSRPVKIAGIGARESATVKKGSISKDGPLRSVRSGDTYKSVREDIQRIADLPPQKDTRGQKVTVRSVTGDEISQVKNATGIDLTPRYRHVVDKSAMNHALKQHGDARAEEARGQVAISAEDFKRIPDIIDSPDSIERGNSRGLDSIVYRKAFNGDVYYVEEVRTGREELAFRTMWKMRRRSGQVIAPPTRTSETTPTYDKSNPEAEETQGENGAAAESTPAKDQTDTPAFKKWFGDSKVVDENGQPLAVYHGTAADFDTFSGSGRGSGHSSGGLGHWFSDKPEIANGFAEFASGDHRQIIPAFLSLQNPKVYGPLSPKEIENRRTELEAIQTRIEDANDRYKEAVKHLEEVPHEELFEGGFKGSPKVQDLQKRAEAAKNEKEILYRERDALSMDDPFEQLMSDRDEHVERSQEPPRVRGTFKGHMMEKNTKEANAEFVAKLKSEGYDGIIVRSTRYDSPDQGPPVSSQYIAFGPTQIKSAIGNNGNFDANDPNILKSVAGPDTIERDGKTFEQRPVLIAELLKRDPDLREYIEKENPNPSRKAQAPVFVGVKPRGVILDGMKSIAQAISNGKRTIMAYVEPVEALRSITPSLQALKSAHTEDVLALQTGGEIKGRNLHLSEADAESLRRLLGEQYYRLHGEEAPQSAFDGATWSPRQLRTLIDLGRERRGEYIKAGYTEEQLAGRDRLLKNLDELLKVNENHAVTYVFDDQTIIGEEETHREDLDAGRTTKEAIRKIKKSPFWSFGGAFEEDYGHLNDADKTSEIAAKLATRQEKKYGWDAIPNFKEEKDKVLATWANGIVEKNEQFIREHGFDAFAKKYERIATYAKDPSRTDTEAKGSKGADAAPASSGRAARPPTQTDAAAEAETDQGEPGAVSRPAGEEVGGDNGRNGSGREQSEEGNEPVSAKVTSTKNRIVDEEREARGLPPAMKVAKRDFGKVWDDAMRIAESGGRAQDTLIEELRNKPRAVTDTENALLLHRQIDLQNEYDKAADALNEAATSDDYDAPTLVAMHRAILARISDDLLDLYNIGKAVGTESGRGLNARKMMVAEDFTLASLERQKRAANDGRRLTEAEHDELSRMAEEYKKRSEAYEEALRERERRIGDMQTQLTMKEIRDSANPPHVIKMAEKLVETLDKQAEEARKKLEAIKSPLFSKTEGQQPLKSVSSDIPAEVMKPLADIGASHIAKSGTDFDTWSDRMVGEFGDKIKPYLDTIYKASNRIIDRLSSGKGIGVRERVKKEKTIENLSDKIRAKVEAGEGHDITGSVKDIARRFVEEGVTEREPLIDAVWNVLKASGMPKITRRETMDAISGYGQFSQLSKDEIDVTLRDLKGQMQQIGKLDDMAHGQAPSKTGVERRTPTDEERRLIQKVEAQKKEGGYTVTDPATQLRTALQAAKTRLQHQIADLEKQIASREKIIKNPRQVPFDEEANLLKARRDELKKQFEEVFGKREMTDEQRLKAWTDRTKRRMDELTEKLANRDFSKRKQRPPVPLDKQAAQLKVEMDRLKRTFENEVEKDRHNNRTRSERYLDNLASYSRGAMLSGVSSLLKVGMASLERPFTMVPEHIVGGAISLAIPKLAAKAPLEGGLNMRAEAKAITSYFMSGMADAARIISGIHKGGGHSDLDVQFSKRDSHRSLLEFFGVLHGALKAPAKRAEFERSMQIRLTKLGAAGHDIADPLLQATVAVEAYKDANRAVFMQDNLAVKAYKAAVRTVEGPRDDKGHIPTSRKLLSTAMRIMLPIVRVPTNIGVETANYTGGSVIGGFRLGAAILKGIDNLSEEQAESILRQLKKGSVGMVGLGLGFFNPQMFGGYYQPGEKRDEKDVGYGKTRLFGIDIPSVFLHNPLLETMQIGATVRRVMDSKFHKGDMHDRGIASGIFAGALGLGEEVPFIKEIFDISSLKDPLRRESFIGNLVRSRMIPRIITEAAEVTDKNADGQPIKRQPDGIIDSLKMGLPGLRQQVPMAYKTLAKRGTSAEEWMASDNFARSHVGTVATQIAQEKAAGNDTSLLTKALLDKAEDRAFKGKLSQADADKVNAILGLTGDKAIKADASNLTVKEEQQPDETFVSEKSFIGHLGVIADALGTDPVDAFKKWYHGETIRKVSGDTIVVERMDMDASEKVKRDRKAGKDMRLDHTIPLEIGGENSLDNLKVVPEQVWASYTPVENALGDALKQGKITGAEARRLISDFKLGWIGTPQIAARLNVPEASIRPVATGTGKAPAPRGGGFSLKSSSLRF